MIRFLSLCSVLLFWVLLLWAGPVWAICGKSCICGVWNNFCVSSVQSGGNDTGVTGGGETPWVPPPRPPVPVDGAMIARKEALQADADALLDLLEKPVGSTAARVDGGVAGLDRTVGNWDIGYTLDARIGAALIPRGRAEGLGMQEAGGTAADHLMDALGIAALTLMSPVDGDGEDAAFLMDQIGAAASGGEVLVDLNRGHPARLEVTVDSPEVIRGKVKALIALLGVYRKAEQEKTEVEAARAAAADAIVGTSASPPCDGLGHCTTSEAREQWQAEVVKRDIRAADLDRTELIAAAEATETVAEIATEIRRNVKIRVVGGAE